MQKRRVNGRQGSVICLTDESEKMTADTVKYNGNTVLSSAYVYDDNDNITNKLYNLKFDGEDNTVDIKNQYDSEGRITATGYGEHYIYYCYDSDGQLTRVDNEYYGNTTSVYSYDSRGNITVKNVYQFTRDEAITSTPTETKTFIYANFGWKDLLVAVDGLEFTYNKF